jgi:hypothetical protein
VLLSLALVHCTDLQGLPCTDMRRCQQHVLCLLPLSNRTCRLPDSYLLHSFKHGHFCTGVQHYRLQSAVLSTLCVSGGGAGQCLLLQHAMDCCATAVCYWGILRLVLVSKCCLSRATESLQTIGGLLCQHARLGVLVPWSSRLAGLTTLAADPT